MLPVIADSNWLLSTLVQSAAALVAIVGGLLVTRLVTLATERNGTERRIRQLQRVADTRRQQADLAAQAWLDKDADSFLDDCEAKIIENYGQVNFDEMYAAEDNSNRTEAELRPYFDKFCERVADINRDLIKAFGESRPENWEDERPALERETPHTDRYLLGQVLDNLERGPWIKPRSRYDLYVPEFVRLTPSLYSATNRATADRRYDETVREAETARGAQRIAEVDLEQAKADLEAMGRPAGMADAFRVLLAIAFTGIVLPLAVMSNGAYKVPAWLRITLVALFVLSLAAFMQFLRGELGRAIGSPLPIFMQGRSGSSGLRGWWGRLRPPYRARRPRGSAPDAAADRTPS